MQDPFIGTPTRISGRRLPGPEDEAALLHDHERRLEAFDRLLAAGAECGIATDPDRHCFLLPEDEVSLLETIGGTWAALGEAVREFRSLVPLLPLDSFGFPADSEDPLSEPNPHLSYIGGGVEAWAYADASGSVYKFYRPREGLTIGATFAFDRDENGICCAQATLGAYVNLLEKLWLIQIVGGMPTEVLGSTAEGILVAKQPPGARLPDGYDVTPHLPKSLIPWPSRFLRCDRDHPRLFFADGRPWLVADPHDRNIVRDANNRFRIIDIVAAGIPRTLIAADSLLADWLERIERDPHAGALPDVSDELL